MTEISQQERAALEWRSTFDAMHEPIFVEGADGKIARLNRAALNLTGKKFNQVLGTSFADFGDEDLWRVVTITVAQARAIQYSQLQQFTDKITTKTWDIHAEWFVLPNFDENWVVVSLYDVTEKVALQESVRRYAVMSAMGTLVAGVAHEVRNPLFGISAILDAMEIHLQENETYNRFNGILRKEVGRLTSLMSELLEYGKPSSVELAKEMIAPVVYRALRTTKILAEQHKVQIVTEIEENLPPIMLEASRLLQVFQNLMENAVQHSPSNQEVLVQISQFTERKKVWIRCVFRDHGKGFAVEDLPRIFDPFFTRRRNGIGLGLSIVQRIIEEHHGEIRAENHPDGGAIITLKFPAVARGK